jgi:hypothetical protein
MEAFVKRHGLTFPSIADPDGEIFRRFGVPGQPAWAFVDAKGSVQRVNGELSRAELTGRLAALART